MGIRLYGMSNDKHVLEESQEAREIVKKIVEYGVTQKQLLYIIYDLAMNLEKDEDTKKITNACKEIAGEAKSPVIITSGEPKRSLEV